MYLLCEVMDAWDNNFVSPLHGLHVLQHSPIRFELGISSPYLCLTPPLSSVHEFWIKSLPPSVCQPQACVI